ncbi:DUF6328 family protein [Streptomyces minutiscleroticus]|uniref:Uncharacterized protein n=1 Tax=Streptomyces minutiscleroticus TaxID=68238 RepID=A0A918NL86_9ACTN|nr:DUF6328 family protein [Streptomyces minutiscleroticus]GGX78171.1 hypothetical protein GCM10010358_35690 [Streptomyces minutiscleroticus]
MTDHRHHSERNETRLERADRNFVELLQELRVTQTGVQILFAFLLSLAFTPRFPSLDDMQRTTYVVTLLLSVLAAALFTAPAAVHRMLFQQGAKPQIVHVSSHLARIGMMVLALALTGSVLLVSDVALGRTGGVIAGAGTLLVCVGLWLMVPHLVGRAIDREKSRERSRDGGGPVDARTGTDEDGNDPDQDGNDADEDEKGVGGGGKRSGGGGNGSDQG